MYIKSYSMSRKIYLKTLLFMGLCLWITAGLKAQEPGPGPISPEGEIEDPLAPVRLAPGRQAFGPAKSQASDDWSFEVRLGGGIAYEVTPGLSLQAEGGAMVWRTFDFPRLNNNVNSTMAPYFQIALRGQF